ncbi:universal stress protein Sll1388-like [Montipora capricornis]|uniref:universal stress protein Sll1388-like n=1 Tax=Montipora foliosa TaxID=591990 RepID=UPI0035F1C8BF
MSQSGLYQRKVVLGVDASEHSERAFDWYIRNLCDKETDILLIVHARELPSVAAAPFASYGYWYYEDIQKEVEKSAKEMNDLLKGFGDKCKHHGVNFKLYKEESNRPGEVICKLAADDHAHVIVIGARGLNTLRQKILGSVSEYCMHHTHVPLVVVPSSN